MIRQLFRYMVSGGSAAATHFGVLWCLVEYARVAPTLATTLGFAAAVVVNYSMLYYWTFAAVGNHGVVLARYLVVTLFGMLLNLLLFTLFFEFLELWYLSAQAIATLVVLIFNFTVNRRYTFAN